MTKVRKNDRRQLPSRRPCVTVTQQRFVAGMDKPVKIHATIGFDKPGGDALEVFGAGGGRADSFIDYELDDAAVLVSLALQYGCPADVLRKSMARAMRGEQNEIGPMSLAGNLVDMLCEVIDEEKTAVGGTG